MNSSSETCKCDIQDQLNYKELRKIIGEKTKENQQLQLEQVKLLAEQILYKMFTHDLEKINKYSNTTQ